MEIPPWNVRQRVWRIKASMESTHSCVIEHCYREAKSLVDELVNIITNERVVGLDVSKLT